MSEATKFHAAVEEPEAGAAGFGSCPLPTFEHRQIVLGHGSGGKLTADLIDKIFLLSKLTPIKNCMRVFNLTK